jgi:hypothetical protein
MKAHLAKHCIFERQEEVVQGHETGATKQPSIVSMFRNKMEQDVRCQLEQNLLCWIITDNVAFVAVESPAFQQIFKDLLDMPLPFTLYRTVAQWIDLDFEQYWEQLINDLAVTCSSIVLSLDV